MSDTTLPLSAKLTPSPSLSAVSGDRAGTRGRKPVVPDKDRKSRAPRTGGTHLARDASAEAKRLAAAILEVLAGVRTPTQAASALGVSLPHYYQLESRALAGFLQACEPRSKGPLKSVERELSALRREQQRWQRDLARQQALVRLTQRSIGLAAPITPPPIRSPGKKPRRRRPVSRALQVATRLRAAEAVVPAPEVSVQKVE
jgi:hypothetical protein